MPFAAKARFHETPCITLRIVVLIHWIHANVVMSFCGWQDFATCNLAPRYRL
jgi:hypothetical protein